MIITISMQVGQLTPQIISEHFLASHTGILTLKNGHVIKTLHFDCGNIIFATSTDNDDKLDAKLIKWGTINEVELQKAKKLRAQYELTLLDMLVQMKLIGADAILELIERQMLEMIYDLFPLQPETNFKESDLPDYEHILKYPTECIIFEGIRRIDDRQLIDSLIGNLDAVLQIDENLWQIYQLGKLTPDEEKVVNHITAQPQNVRALIKNCNIAEKVIMKTVAGLLQTGLASRINRSEFINVKPAPLASAVEPEVKGTEPKINAKVEAKVEKIEAPPIKQSVKEEIITPGFDTRAAMEFCYEVETKLRAINSGISLYQILEINHHASEAELTDAYERLSNYFHPDRNKLLAEYNLDLRYELETIFHKLTQAVEILTNPNAKEGYEQEVSMLFKRPVTANHSANKKKSSEAPTAPLTNDVKSAAAVEFSSQQAIMEFCYQVETKLNEIKNGATYYQLLELDRDATRDKIETSYQRLASFFNLKKQQELTKIGIDLSASLSEINHALNKASDTLSYPLKKQLYDDELGKNLRRDNGHKVTDFSSRETKPLSAPPPQFNANLVSDSARPSGSVTLPKVQAQPFIPTPTVAPPVKAEPVKAEPVKAEPVKADPARTTQSDKSAAVTQELPKNPVVPGKKSKSLSAAEHYMRSIELIDNRQFEQAAEELRKALEVAPKEALYWGQLGRVYTRIHGSQKQAESAFMRAMELDKEDADLPCELGNMYLKYGLMKKAYEMYQRALQIDANHSEAKQGLENLAKHEPGKGGGGLLSKLGFNQD